MREGPAQPVGQLTSTSPSKGQSDSAPGPASKMVGFHRYLSGHYSFPPDSHEAPTTPSPPRSWLAELNASDSSTGSSGRVADRAARPQGVRGGKCPVKNPGIPPHFAQGPSSSRQTFLGNSRDVFLPTRSSGNHRGYCHLEPHGRRASSRPKSGEKPFRHARNSRGAYAREPLIPLGRQFRPRAPVSSPFQPKGSALGRPVDNRLRSCFPGGTRERNAKVFLSDPQVGVAPTRKPGPQYAFDM